MLLATERWLDISFSRCYLHNPSHILANSRQRIADEHVYHAGAAEAGVHEDHPLRLIADLEINKADEWYEARG